MPAGRRQCQPGEQLDPMCHFVVAEEPALCRQRPKSSIEFMNGYSTTAVQLALDIQWPAPAQCGEDLTAPAAERECLRFNVGRDRASPECLTVVGREHPCCFARRSDHRLDRVLDAFHDVIERHAAFSNRALE